MARGLAPPGHLLALRRGIVTTVRHCPGTHLHSPGVRRHSRSILRPWCCPGCPSLPTGSGHLYSPPRQGPGDSPSPWSGGVSLRPRPASPPSQGDAPSNGRSSLAMAIRQVDGRTGHPWPSTVRRSHASWARTLSPTGRTVPQVRESSPGSPWSPSPLSYGDSGVANR